MPDEPTPATGSETCAPGSEHPVWSQVGVFPDSGFAEQAWTAFQQELPLLLESARGQYVAYHGAERIGIARSPVDLYEASLRRGLSPEEYVICPIEPIVGQEVLGLGGARIMVED